jgi:hypothetical protein
MQAEGVDFIAKFGKSGGGRSTGKTGAHDDDPEFAPIGGIDQFGLETMTIPFLCEGARGNA